MVWAEHAFRDGGEGSGWTNIGHAVAIEALEAEGEVLFMGVGDGLLRAVRRPLRLR